VKKKRRANMWDIIKLIIGILVLIFVIRFAKHSWDTVNTIEFSLSKEEIEQKFDGYIVVSKGEDLGSIIFQVDSTRKYVILLDDIVFEAFAVGDTVEGPEEEYSDDY
jgi:hypothetical protein